MQALESPIGEQDRVGVATINDEIATCLGNLGELDDALEGHRQALKVFEDEHVAMSEFTCLTNLAKALHARGDEEEATRRMVRAVDLAEGFGWIEDAMALCEQAAAWTPDLRVAEQLWRRVLDFHAIVGGAGSANHPIWLASIHYNLGVLYLRRGAHEAALAQAREARAAVAGVESVTDLPNLISRLEAAAKAG